MEAGGPGGDALPPAVMATALIQNHDKFCGLLNSLGEQSFAEDMDMSNRASVQRKNEMLSARKFATDDNKVLKGLEKHEGGEERFFLAKDALKRTGRYATTLRRYACEREAYRLMKVSDVAAKRVGGRANKSGRKKGSARRQRRQTR